MAVVVPIISEWNPKGVDRALADIQRAEGKLGKMKVGLEKAFLPAVAALTGVAAAGYGAAKSAEEVASANAALGQVFDSMGYSEATARVQEYAEALEMSLGIDEKTIKATQTKLGTFKELTKTAGDAGGAFDRATVAALDLAAAGFGTAESNAVQLGKALQDPVKGITALTRSGVTFTAAEQEKIKALAESGKALEAQEMILAAIETQVGGTAEATGDSSAKMSLAWGNVTESIGMALLPAFDALNGLMVKVAGFAKENTGVIIGLGAAIGAVAGLIIAANVAMKAWAAAQAIIKGLTVAWTAVQWLLNAALTANPIGLVVVAIAGLIAIIVLAWKKSDTFRAIVTGAFEGVKKVVGAVVDWFKGPFLDGLKIAFEWIKKGIEIYLTPWRLAFEGIKKVIEILRTVFETVFAAIQTAIENAWQFIQPILDKIMGAVKGVMDAIGGIANVAGGIIGGIGNIFGRAAPAPSMMSRGASPVNITVQAGIGNPVAIAREVEGVLRARQIRLGTP